MKICITAQGNNLDSQIDPRFGRCQYFLIYDSGSKDIEAIENPNIAAAGGAGIQSGQLIADKQVEVVLTGNVGPNAFQTLQASGIEIITGLSGSIKEVIEKYEKGKLNPTQSSTVDSKFGMGGAGKGSGFGRNMRNTQGFNKKTENSQTQKNNKKENLKKLEEQAKNLQEKISEIEKNIDELKEEN